jgi:hypothetical protein
MTGLFAANAVGSVFFGLCRFSFHAHELFLAHELWKGEAKVSVVPLAIQGRYFCLMLLDVEELYSTSLYILINVLAVLVKFFGLELLR